MQSVRSPAVPEESGSRAQKLSHVIADHFRSQIVAGKLKPGDRIPPETELLTVFNVSRPTLREAMRVLEVESLIALGRGSRSGATVLAPSMEVAARYAAMVLVAGSTTQNDLHEARTILEPPMIVRLGQKAKKTTLRKLESYIEVAQGAMDNSDYRVALFNLNEFHSELVIASGNRALIFITEMLRLLSETTVDALTKVDDAQLDALHKDLLTTIATFIELVRLLREAKTDEAEALWRRYLERARNFLVRTGLGARQVQLRIA